MDQQDGQSGRIHVQYHGNHPEDNEYFDWEDEISAETTGSGSSITATAIAENSASVKNVLEDFEEFNLDDCEELTEEEKELLLMYIQNNHGSVVFTDVNEDDDMQQTEPPPDYGDYYSGRYLETIYEEDSDDLRSWDSDEVDDMLRLSPSSDDHLGLAVSPSRKTGKEPDKDSSYDSDYSLVNSTECLDSDNRLEKDDHKSQMTSDVGLSSDDEINATLYNEEDIEDVLCRVISPATIQNQPEEPKITSLQSRIKIDKCVNSITGCDSLCDATCEYVFSDKMSSTCDFYANDLVCERNVDDDRVSVDAIDSVAPRPENSDDEDHDGVTRGSGEIVHQPPAVGKSKVTSCSSVEMNEQVSAGDVAPSVEQNVKLDLASAKQPPLEKNVEFINSDTSLEKIRHGDKIEWQRSDVDKDNEIEACDGSSSYGHNRQGQLLDGRCATGTRPAIQVPIDTSQKYANSDDSCKLIESGKSREAEVAGNGLSRSASEELYNMLPKVDELPEIKEICYSWFDKSPARDAASSDDILFYCDVNEVERVKEQPSEIEGKFVYARVSDDDDDDVGIPEMCQSHESQDWEQWLAHSLDEKSGRHVTSGAYFNNHHTEQLNLPTSDVTRSYQVFLDDDVVISPHCVAYSRGESELRERPSYEFCGDFDRIRGRSLPKNYQPCTEAERDDGALPGRGHERAEVVKFARGNSLSNIRLQCVGVSREIPPLIFESDFCGSITRSVRERSKSTPDLSTKGGKREETLVKKIEHTSQVKVEVCELSPGLQYKKHCVIVNESVSAKTAKFEALVNKNSSRNNTSKHSPNVSDSSPGLASTITGGNSTPEMSDARVNVIHHSSRTESEHPKRCLSFSSSDDEKEDEHGHVTMIGARSLSNPAGTSRRHLSADIRASPSNGMRRENTSYARTINGACDSNDETAQLLSPKTDVSKLVAMFENEIKKSEPRHSSAALVIRGGDRTLSRIATSSLPSQQASATTTKNIIDVSPEHFNKITGLQSGIRATALKPPLPPRQHETCHQVPFQSLLETTPRTWRYVSARKHFLNAKAKNSQHQEETSSDDAADDEQKKLVRLTSDRLSKFQRSAQVERARLAKSVPDLVSTADKLFSEVRLSAKIDQSSPSKFESNLGKKIASRRRQELSKSRNEDEWDKLLTAAATHYGKRYEKAKQRYEENPEKNLSKSYGYLETDLDTLECREVDQTNLDDVFCDDAKTSTSTSRSRAKSLISLGLKKEDSTASSDGSSVDGSRAKSMEFLLDGDNKAAAIPPENQLMRDGKIPSEHELRFQKSLKNLTLPSWYCDSMSASISKSKNGTLGDNDQDFPPRWQGLSSRSSSSNSLSGVKSSTSNKPVIVPKRVTADWRYIKYGIHSSKESLTPRSPSTAPDSPTEDSSFSYHPSLSRWNTARMSNTSTSSFGGGSLYRSFRQPYLGWRSSAERLCANSGHPSNSSSQCPSPSSSAISAASSNFAFRPDRTNFGIGLSKWANLGTVHMYNTDTDSEFDCNSRPSSAMAEGANQFQGFKSSWRQPSVENQQVAAEPEARRSEGVKASELCHNPRLNGHCESEELSSFPGNGRHVWMESSFVGKKQNSRSASPVHITSLDNNCANCKSMVAPGPTVAVQSSERPQGEYYAMLRNQHKNLLCT